jgi:tRNA(fMet)-specific endonuclease VapC
MRLVPVAPLDASVASHYGQVRSELERKGTPIGPYDLMIAAHALTLHLTLVTTNVREFARVSGLKIENWAA